jgi:hypothetical protein
MRTGLWGWQQRLGVNLASSQTLQPTSVRIRLLELLPNNGTQRTLLRVGAQAMAP